MDRLHAMSQFVRVVEAGGFSAVAREQRSTQGAVSKQVAALERHLGVRLLNRTTRALSLTEEGRHYFDVARRLVQESEELERELRDGKTRISGRLRIGASVAFGRLVLFDIAKQFMTAHPGIDLDIRLADHFIDLVADGLDLSVRAGEIQDGSLVAQRVGTAPRMLVASRRYLEARREPLNHPDDLRAHDCIQYTGMSVDAWSFEGPAGPVAVKVAGRIRSNSSEMIRQAVLDGMGIGFAPGYLFVRELAAGDIVPLLPAYRSQPIPLHVVYPPSRRNSAKVAAFTDAVREGLAACGCHAA